MFNKKRVLLLMIVFLIISCYIYFEVHNKICDTYFKSGNYLCNYLKIVDFKNLKSNIIHIIKNLSLINIRKVLFSIFSRTSYGEVLSLSQNKHCKYLIVLLDPWDIPEICIFHDKNEFDSEEIGSSGNYSTSSKQKSIFFEEIVNMGLDKDFQDKLDMIKKLKNNFSIEKFEEDILFNPFLTNEQSRISGYDYLNLLINISMNAKLNNYKCGKYINIRKLWEFGRILCKIDKEIVSNCDDSKYYEFISLIYYNCIYGLKNYKIKNYFKKKVDNTDDFEEKLFEIVTCYESIPIYEIEDKELLFLNKLCEWKRNKYLLEYEYKIEMEEMKIIKEYIKYINRIFLDLDLVNLRLKYIDMERNRNNNNNTDNDTQDYIINSENVFHIYYFKNLIKLIKIVNDQLILQYLFISDEINKFIDSTKENKNSNLVIVDYSQNDVDNYYGKENDQLADSINWKHVFSSIIDNTQNVLVREHINTMLINFAFDAIIRIFNPWISLFYQASFIINSYLSIISFLIIIAAILICFNTIPCFRNEKNKEKSDKLWKKIVRIYKINVLVLLLNIMFTLGSLLRYLYLPNEIELLNSNIAIIKAVNKLLNIVLCPFVINIINSFSTIFSIFQWQVIWFNSKFSFSSILNL